MDSLSQVEHHQSSVELAGVQYPCIVAHLHGKFGSHLKISAYQTLMLIKDMNMQNLFFIATLI